MGREVIVLESYQADFLDGVSVVSWRSGIDNDSDAVDSPSISRESKSTEGEKRDDGMGLL